MASARHCQSAESIVNNEGNSRDKSEHQLPRMKAIDMIIHSLYIYLKESLMDLNVHGYSVFI